MKHWCKATNSSAAYRWVKQNKKKHTWSVRRHHSGCRSRHQEPGVRLRESSLGPRCLRWRPESLGSEVKRPRPSVHLLGRPAMGLCLWPWRHRWRRLCCSVWRWRRWRRCRCQWRCPEGSRWAPGRSAHLNASRLRTTSRRCGRSWRRCWRACCCWTGWMSTERPAIQR